MNEITTREKIKDLRDILDSINQIANNYYNRIQELEIYKQNNEDYKNRYDKEKEQYE